MEERERLMHICQDEIAGIFAFFAFCCMTRPWIRHYVDRAHKRMHEYIHGDED